MKKNHIREKKENNVFRGKTPSTNLDRFRNDVLEFAKQTGGLAIPINKINSKAGKLSRKEMRKLERKLKHAKREAFFKKETVKIRPFFHIFLKHVYVSIKVQC